MFTSVKRIKELAKFCVCYKGRIYTNDGTTYPSYPRSSAKHKALLQLDVAKILGICHETKAKLFIGVLKKFMMFVCFECMPKYFIR